MEKSKRNEGANSDRSQKKNKHFFFSYKIFDYILYHLLIFGFMCIFFVNVLLRNENTEKIQLKK